MMSYVETRRDNELIDRVLRARIPGRLISDPQRLVYSVSHTCARNRQDVSDVFQQVARVVPGICRNSVNVGALPVADTMFTAARYYALSRSRRYSEQLKGRPARCVNKG